MNLDCRTCLKLSMVLIASVVLSAGMTGNTVYALMPPCPVVTDITIAQMAQRWAAMFRDPYCGFLQERRNILLRQKLAGGVFGHSSQVTNIFKTMEETPGSGPFKAVGKTTGRIDQKSMGIQEIANAKVRTLRTRASVMAYAAGRDAFGKAVQLEKILQRFAPEAFDFSSKHQSQKDAVKLTRIRGLIQTQELKILSILRMMHAVEGEQ